MVLDAPLGVHVCFFIVRTCDDEICFLVCMYEDELPRNGVRKLTLCPIIHSTIRCESTREESVAPFSR